MKIAIIAAVARNGVIGDQGRIPWHIREDLKRFKRLTLGHAIIMGRKTFQSIGKPLPGRRNIVLTHNPAFQPAGVLTFPDLTQALRHLGTLHSEAVFIIGGAEIYREALPRADVLYLTHVHRDVTGDTTFPDYSRAGWAEAAREDHDGFSFVEYQRV